MKRLLALVFLTSVLVASFSITASAAVLYRTKPGNCDNQDLKVDPPYKQSGNSYYCVNELNAGEWTPAPCGTGVAAAQTGLFGPLCLTKSGSYLFSAASSNPNNGGQSGSEKLMPVKFPGSTSKSGKTCGEPGTDSSIDPSFDLGCRGKGNGILDLLFAIIRLLTVGVGLVVIGSIIVAGIQYTSSRGDPQAVAAAIKRVNATIIALVIYIFSFALLNWIIPGAVLK